MERNKEALKKELTTNINKDILCNLSGVCAQHLEVKTYLDTLPELSKTCQQQQEFLVLLKDSLNSLKSGSYSYTAEFNVSIKNLLRYLQYQQAQKYLTALSVPKNSSNGELLLDVMESFTTTGNNTFDSSLSLAVVQEMIKQQETCRFFTPNFNFVPFTLIDINVEKVSVKEINLNLIEPLPRCPIYGKEQSCCLSQECIFDEKNTPILFVHGHAFNKEISTEYSLNAFNQLQNKLIEEGYIDAGALSEYNYNTDAQGVWKVIPAPFTFKGSYYYDFFAQGSNYQLVQTKSENIDTYAIRMKDMVDWIKYKTGRPKVIIIAHSMGGLVSRRYLQIFGSESVKELILIGTPNYGIVGNAADYCSVVGEQLECRDMSEDSLFLNKLNRESLPQIPIYNIIGVGCDTDGEEGDGIVPKEKVELPSKDNSVHNYYINGNCTGTDYLHSEMLNMDKYPEVYEIVKEAVSD
ncbi:MAG: alpha/beta fold hydrolase [Nanoarchaeota archaeon]